MEKEEPEGRKGFGKIPKSLASRACWRSERSIQSMLECSRKNKRA